MIARVFMPQNDFGSSARCIEYHYDTLQPNELAFAGEDNNTKQRTLQ